jgi:hypothetical protein
MRDVEQAAKKPDFIFPSLGEMVGEI